MKSISAVFVLIQVQARFTPRPASHAPQTQQHRHPILRILIINESCDAVGKVASRQIRRREEDFDRDEKPLCGDKKSPAMTMCAKARFVLKTGIFIAVLDKKNSADGIVCRNVRGMSPKHTFAT